MSNSVPPTMRKPYSWRAIAALAGCTAALLFLMYSCSAEKAEVVKSWDFVRLEPGQWQWTFPGGNPEQHSQGAAYTVDETKPGPRVEGLDIRADECTAVRVELHMIDLATGKEVEPKLDLYWARAEDYDGEKNSWKFGNERGCAFDVLDRHKPNTFTARVAHWRDCDKKQWNGAIQSLFITVKLPSPSSPKGYKVILSRAEFIRF